MFSSPKQQGVTPAWQNHPLGSGEASFFPRSSTLLWCIPLLARCALLLFLLFPFLFLFSRPVFAFEEGELAIDLVAEEGLLDDSLSPVLSEEVPAEVGLSDGIFSEEAFSEEASFEGIEEDFREAPLSLEDAPAFTDDLSSLLEEELLPSEENIVKIEIIPKAPFEPLYIGHPLQGFYEEREGEFFFTFYSLEALSRFDYILTLSDGSKMAFTPFENEYTIPYSYHFSFDLERWQRGEDNLLHISIGDVSASIPVPVEAPAIESLTEGIEKTFEGPNAGEDLLLCFTPEETSYYSFLISKDVPFEVVMRDGAILPMYAEEDTSSLPLFALKGGSVYTLVLEGVDPSESITVLCQKETQGGPASKTATSFSATLSDLEGAPSVGNFSLGYWEDTDTFVFSTNALLYHFLFHATYEDGSSEYFTYRDLELNPCLDTVYVEKDYVPYHLGDKAISFMASYAGASTELILPVTDYPGPLPLQVGETMTQSEWEGIYFFTPPSTGTYVFKSLDKQLVLSVDEARTWENVAFAETDETRPAIVPLTGGTTYLFTIGKEDDGKGASFELHELTDISFSLAQTDVLNYGSTEIGYWDTDGSYQFSPVWLDYYMQLSGTLETGETLVFSLYDDLITCEPEGDVLPGKPFSLKVTIGEKVARQTITLRSLMDQYPQGETLTLEAEVSLPLELKPLSSMAFLIKPKKTCYYHVSDGEMNMYFSLYENPEEQVLLRVDYKEDLYYMFEEGHTYLLVATSSYSDSHTLQVAKAKTPVSIQLVREQGLLPLTPLPDVNGYWQDGRFYFQASSLGDYISCFVVYEDGTGETLNGNDSRLLIAPKEDSFGAGMRSLTAEVSLAHLKSSITLPVASLEECFQNAPTLSLEEETELANYSALYSLATFTPKEDGCYLLFYGGTEVHNYLYDPIEKKYFTGRSYDAPTPFVLEGGKTYYIIALHYFGSPLIATVEKRGIASFTATPREDVHLLYGSEKNGYWYDKKTFIFFSHSIFNALDITLTMEDGSEIALDSYSPDLTLESGSHLLTPGKWKIVLYYFDYSCTTELQIWDYETLAALHSPLALDTPIKEQTGDQVFAFTPKESKTYWFTAKGYDDLEARLLTSDGQELSFASPDAWEDFAFVLSSDLEAGNTYYFEVTPNSPEEVYSVWVTGTDPSATPEIDLEATEGKEVNLFLLLDDSSYTQELLQREPTWLTTLTDRLDAAGVKYRLACIRSIYSDEEGPTLLLMEKEDGSPWYGKDDIPALQESLTNAEAQDSNILLWEALLTITDKFVLSYVEENEVLCIATSWGSETNSQDILEEEELLEKLTNSGISYSAITSSLELDRHTGLAGATGGVLLDIEKGPALAMEKYAAHLLTRIAHHEGRPQVTLGKPSRPAAQNKAKGISLSWKAVPDGGLYQIYRSKNGGKYKLLAEIQGLSYLDTKVKSLATYSYKIRAVGYETAEVIYQTGKKSKVRTLTYLPACQKIKVSKKGVVTWKKIKNVTGYQVLISTQKTMKNPITLTVKGYKKTKATLKKLSPATYYVTVRAYVEKDGRTYGPLGTKKKFVVKK